MTRREPWSTIPGPQETAGVAPAASRPKDAFTSAPAGAARRLYRCRNILRVHWTAMRRRIR